MVVEVVVVEVVLAMRWGTWSRWSGVEPGDRYSSFRWSCPVATSSRSNHCAAKHCGKIPQSQPGSTDRQTDRFRQTDRTNLTSSTFFSFSNSAMSIIKLQM